MSYIKKEVIGGQTLYLGDCLEVMRELGRFDAVVTDPPYGIGESGGKFRDRKGGGHRVLNKKEWDSNRPCDEVFLRILDISKSQVIWGGNYFADILPASKGWLYWDKLMGGDFADGELAWTNVDKALRKFTKCNKSHGKEHPTQKPVELMEWCLSWVKDSQTILDPFMGSGTTLVSCQRMGRMGTGIELDPEYFDIACRRVDEAARQPDMFVQAVVEAPKQEELF